jgi:hypothetical protein
MEFAELQTEERHALTLSVLKMKIVLVRKHVSIKNAVIHVLGHVARTLFVML